jgi:pyridoxine/pyridoxamine 5'-phosphate oxidase
MSERSAHARRIIDSNAYMTLATADADGRPWASPVWFAHDGHAHFIWVSKPEARHSRNLAVRPDAGIVFFDSTPRQGTPEAVYVEARAEQVAEKDEKRLIEIFSRRSESMSEPAWTVEDVRAPARLRLYRATATEMFVLGEKDERIAVELA